MDTSANEYTRDRKMEWNSDKFWCQIAAPKENEKVIKNIAQNFIGLFGSKCRTRASP